MDYPFTCPRGPRGMSLAHHRVSSTAKLSSYLSPKIKSERLHKETGAIPFDAPDVELGHHEGRCSFESILLKYDLKDAGLLRMAKIVHAADVAEDIDSDPIARGLEAIASGYSLRFPDDMENLDHQFEVYDALYAWCRLDVASTGKS